MSKTSNYRIIIYEGVTFEKLPFYNGKKQMTYPKRGEDGQIKRSFVWSAEQEADCLLSAVYQVMKRKKKKLKPDSMHLDWIKQTPNGGWMPVSM